MSDDLVDLPDGRILEVLELGEPAGSPVVFLPGCPDSRWAGWLGDAPARSSGVRLLAVNRPGYGRSDSCASTHASVADDVAAAMEALGIDRFAILGMSLGGPYALACAARHPDRVTSVTTVAATGDLTRMDPPHHRDGLSVDAGAQLERVRGGTVEEGVSLLRPDFEAYVATMRLDEPDDDLAARSTDGLPERERHLFDGVPPAVLAAQAREALSCPDGYLRDAVSAFRDWAFAVEDVSCAVRVVHGTADVQASVRNARWLAEHVPRATLCLRPGAMHLESLHASWEGLLTGLCSDPDAPSPADACRGRVGRRRSQSAVE